MPQDDDHSTRRLVALAKDLLSTSLLIAGVFLIIRTVSIPTIASCVVKKMWNARDFLDHEEVEDKEDVKVYIDLFGHHGEEIGFEATENRLKVKTDNNEDCFDIVLPSEVNPDTMRIARRNRVVEIRLQKRGEK